MEPLASLAMLPTVRHAMMSIIVKLALVLGHWTLGPIHVSTIVGIRNSLTDQFAQVVASTVVNVYLQPHVKLVCIDE